MAQELGVRAEGGIFILFFLFAWREASGYWRGHICGFSGGKKNITFFFGRNIARVKILP
jgi:hypothetical protein